MHWPTESDELTFRAWVLNDMPHFPGANDDLEELYRFYELPSGGHSFSRYAIIAHLEARIRATLEVADEKEGSSLSIEDLRTFSEHLVLRWALDDTPLTPHHDLLARIIDALRGVPADPEDADSEGMPPARARAFSEAAVWKQAIALAYHILHLNPGLASSEEGIRAGEQRSISVAKSASLLRQYGADCRVEGGSVVLSDASRKLIAERLLDIIRSVGPIGVLLPVLGWLRKDFDQEYQRYHLGHRLGTLPSHVNPRVPVGYLLNLCIRELRNDDVRRMDEEATSILFSELIRLSTAFASVWDVQPYSHFDGMGMSIETAERELYELVVYDSVFTFPQLRPTFVVTILRGLFDWVDDARFRARQGWSLNDAIVVVDALLQHCPLATTTKFTADDVASWVPRIPPSEIRKILKALAHSPGYANRRYLLPTDADSIDFNFRPLLTLADGAYLLVDPSWCAPAFFEALMVPLRDTVGALLAQQQLGYAGERFLRKSLEARGIPVGHGRYAVGDLECDAAIETTDHIVVIELKAKALTRRARSGMIAEAVLDILESFVSAQRQAFGHELALRRDGSLVLEGNTRIDLNGRDVECIALTLLDFGGIQDRQVCFRLMDIFMRGKVQHSEPKLAARYEEALLNQAELRKIHTALRKCNPRYDRVQYFNTWFLSIPQFLELLENVHSPDEFWAALMLTRHITAGSRDFIFELKSARGLGGAT